MSQSMQYCKSDLKYKELSNIDVGFFAQIKKIFVFTDNDVLLVTKSNQVYGYGSNRQGKLGFGNETPVLKPTIIPELWGITNVVCSGSFMVAVAETMDVYAWAYSSHVVEEGGLRTHYVKPQKININGERVIDIKCCVDRAYLLTDEKTLYCLERYAGSHFETNTVLASSSSAKKIGISCGFKHFLVLMQDGLVIAAGSNEYGALGSGNVKKVAIRPPFPHKTKSICCGENHNLLLTNNGKIYSFGANSNGQLGIGNKLNQMDPQLITAGVTFIEIFAFRNVSIALSDKNDVFIWGNLRIGDILTPLQTNQKSFQDAIDMYCLNTFIYKPLSPTDAFRKRNVNIVLNTMEQAFNDQTISDLKFKVKSKNRAEAESDYIYVQKWFVAKTSEYFERMFANEWCESIDNVIEINGYSYEAFYQFIRCLYTDTIDTEDVELLIELLEITNEYLHDMIKAKCVEHIMPLVNVENICSIYISSLNYRSSELEDYSFKFMSENIIEIVKTEDFRKMDGDHMKRFFIEFYKNK